VDFEWIRWDLKPGMEIPWRFPLPGFLARTDFPPMNPFLLTTIHLAGALGLFTALGAIITAGSDGAPKWANILHGVSLLVLLLFGLHMLFGPPMKWAANAPGGWWHAKVVIWLFLGAVPALAKRKVLPVPALLGLVIVAGAGAGFLGLAKNMAF
jgi:hypothetical protein